jgi:5-formyltetrahydrofolate cyclo-ligase
MEEKQRIRDKMLSKRKSMGSHIIQGKSEKIKEKIFALDEFRKSKHIVFYYDFRNEVATVELIIFALKTGKIVSLPVIDKKTDSIVLYCIKNITEGFTKNEKYGILEPDTKKCKKENIKLIDLIIIPGIAFDRNKNRLGFGKGYYDKFLKKIPKKTMTMGICYDYQLLADIPITEEDVPVNMVITEKSSIR